MAGTGGPATIWLYCEAVPTDEELGFPKGNHNERELLLSWLAYLRGAVLRMSKG